MSASNTTLRLLTVLFILAGILLLRKPVFGQTITAASTRFSVVIQEAAPGKGAAVILIPGLSSSRDVYAAEAKLLTTSLHLIQIAGPNASGPSQLIESATILLASNHHRDHNTGDVR